MALGSCPEPDSTMAPGVSVGHSNQYGPGAGTALIHHQGHRLWPRTWASVWLLVASWASRHQHRPNYGRTKDPDTDTIPSSSLGLDITMAPGGSIGHLDEHGPLWQCGPQTLLWSQVMTGAGICMAPSGERSHRHQHSTPSWPPVSGPQTKAWQLSFTQAQTSPWTQLASRAFMPTCSSSPCPLRPTSLPIPWTILPPFPFHLPTLYSLTIMNSNCLEYGPRARGSVW